VMVEAEKLSREEALQAYTEYGAYSQKAEDVKGRLVPGQWADIAVFDNDLLEAPADTILSGTRCLMTLLAGRVVHDAR
jgi:predicted amidohydrolase YtcJ